MGEPAMISIGEVYCDGCRALAPVPGHSQECAPVPPVLAEDRSDWINSFHPSQRAEIARYLRGKA